jgi:hypothetical protein
LCSCLGQSSQRHSRALGRQTHRSIDGDWQAYLQQ